MPMRHVIYFESDQEGVARTAVIVGAAVTMDSLLAVEALAGLGFDFLFFDLEHGVFNLETLHHMVALLRGTNTVPIARVASDDAWQTGSARSIRASKGSSYLSSTRGSWEAREVVSRSKYPPAGIRWPGMHVGRGTLYHRPEYVAVANDEILVVVQVETAQAVESIDEIAHRARCRR